MDRIGTGIAIALCALVMSGGYVRDVMAGEAGTRVSAEASSMISQVAVVNGLRSERVLSLILTLEALRVAPALLNGQKV